ncbi:MAG: alpha/beta hydrolase [Thermoanaerobaculia bacterium]
MIEATVRGSLILLAAFAALQVMRHRSAAERELVLRCAILAMLVLSAIAATMHASSLWLAGVAVMGFRLLLSVRAVHKLPAREVRRMGRIHSMNILALVLSTVLATEPVTLPRTNTLRVKAKSNGIAYKLYVSLPRDYETSKQRYPVIYTLDADYSFAVAHNVVEHLADREHLRWAIVVGIAYDGPLQYRLNRTRDYTPKHSPDGGYGPQFQKHSGGGPKFQKFLGEELIPLIERTYRTTDERTLVGHSYGGLFSTWTMLTTDLFTGYVIVSPSLWYDDSFIFGVKGSTRARAYVAAGSIENPVMARDAKRLAVRLGPHKVEILDDETHNSIFPSAFSRGIRFVMKGR